MTTNNLRIWDALGKTDPKHTKSFSRAGGFKGTATKPIWTAMRMTEYFGPCGLGWGMTRPEFQTVPSGEDILVFCTVGLWYVEGTGGTAAVRGEVFGVGGDKCAGKNKNGPFTDDEAFKKAYTDAIGNAMKQIGVSADVHMGLFDDSKYVNEMKREFADDEPRPAEQPPAQRSPPPVAKAVASEDSHKPVFDIGKEALLMTKTVKEYNGWIDDNAAMLEQLEKAAPKMYADLCAIGEAHLKGLAMKTDLRMAG